MSLSISRKNVNKFAENDHSIQIWQNTFCWISKWQLYTQYNYDIYSEILLSGYLIQKHFGIKWISRDELSFHNFQKIGKPLCKIFKVLRKFLWRPINSKIYLHCRVIDTNCKTAAWSASWKFSSPTVDISLRLFDRKIVFNTFYCPSCL